jgi:glycosyltransferase involved in cell wall biosynthesis
MRKVCILTDFYDCDPTYSLNIICEEQISMLKNAGYAPVGVVQEDFKPQRVWNDIELRHIPPTPKHNHVQFDEGWQKNVEDLKAALDQHLDDIDVVLTHDLIYQCAAMWLNYAARWWASSNPGALWLNWVHSATPSPVWTKRDERLVNLQQHFPNSFTVFPNSFDVPRVATNYRCEIDQVAVVPHPTDICGFLKFEEITKRLVREKRLLEADVILVYPVRLDRGKQVEYVMRTAAAVKALGRSARVIVCDFHSTGGDKVTYREVLKALAIDLGLNSIECTFTSEFDKSLEMRVPREVVADLKRLCNVFVQPSVSETYSLITQEAALCGAFLVLNRDFPPFRSIYGPNAAYFQFSSAIDALTGMDGQTTTEYENIDAYFHDIALRVLYELDHNPVLAQERRIRMERNPDYVFRRFIEPLFYSRDG